MSNQEPSLSFQDRLGLPLLDVTPEVGEFAAQLIARVPLPAQAAADAAHMPVAACHRVDFVLTWNVAHIANAILRRRVEDICRAAGYRCTHLVHAGRIDGGRQ